MPFAIFHGELSCVDKNNRVYMGNQIQQNYMSKIEKKSLETSCKSLHTSAGCMVFVIQPAQVWSIHAWGAPHCSILTPSSSRPCFAASFFAAFFFTPLPTATQRSSR